jgi:hypothetical protein
MRCVISSFEARFRMNYGPHFATPAWSVSLLAQTRDVVTARPNETNLGRAATNNRQ